MSSSVKLVCVTAALLAFPVLVFIGMPMISHPLSERATRRVFEDRIVSHWYYNVECSDCEAVMNAIPPVKDVYCHDLWGFSLGNDWDCRVLFADGSTLDLISQWWGLSHTIRFGGPPHSPLRAPEAPEWLWDLEPEDLMLWNNGIARVAETVHYDVSLTGVRRDGCKGRGFKKTFNTWLKAHPNAEIVPVGRAHLFEYYLWVRDGHASLNEALVEEGLCPPYTMMIGKLEWLLISQEEYLAFLDRLGRYEEMPENAVQYFHDGTSEETQHGTECPEGQAYDSLWEACVPTPHVLSSVDPIELDPVGECSDVVVTIEGIVTETGAVKRANVVRVRPGIARCADVAEDAFSKRRYAPTRDDNGDPIRIYVTTTMRFGPGEREQPKRGRSSE